MHILGISKKLEDYNFDVVCLNLLETNTPFDYSQEELAYQNFMSNVGFINASNKIKS